MMEADIKGGPRSLLAPGSPVPKIGPSESELDYVRWAKSSLERGQDAEAELALEWGQVRRRIDEEVQSLREGQPPPPYDQMCQRMLCKAMRSIGQGRSSEAMGYIDTAIDDIAKRTGTE